MKMFKWQYFTLILLILTAVTGFVANTTIAEDDHVPSGITMQQEFKAGFGEPLGIFKKTVGKVVLIHASDTFGYWPETDLPLYMKDTIITPEEGLALLQFLDESTISVAEDSELIINRFIFDPDKFDRSIFLNMNSGKSRFWVKKLKGYTRSEFKVKTKTLIAGVRGSDFIVIVGPNSTEVIALEDTVLEIINLGSPDKIIVLRAFEKIRVSSDGEVSPIEKISPSEAARLRNDLPMPFDREAMEKAGIFETDKTIDPDKMKSKLRPLEEVSGTDQKPGTGVTPKEEIVPTDKPEDEPILDVGDKTVILIPGEELEDPEIIEEETDSQPEDEPILDVGDKTVILIPGEELEDPEIIEEETDSQPEEETDWFAEALPGNEPEVSQVQGQEILDGGPIQDDIIDDIILTPLPGPPPGP